MDSFSLLKYWRGVAAAASTLSTTRAAVSLSPPPEPIDEESDDDGPFFDLHFTDKGKDFSFSMTSSDEIDCRPNPHLPISPENDLLFKGRFFSVLMLRFRKPKTHSAEQVSSSPKQSSDFSKFFIKVEEESPEEKTVQKYLSKIKPLYVRVSKRYSDKMRWEGGDGETGESLKTGEKRYKPDVSSRIRIAYKHLRKSKSAITNSVEITPQRRDDSFLEKQDGIQSAIAHCKRSLTSL